jgi:hypothetical protein
LSLIYPAGEYVTAVYIVPPHSPFKRHILSPRVRDIYNPDVEYETFALLTTKIPRGKIK